MFGNILKYVLQALALVPSVVQGVETIKAEAPGTTKKDLALQSLMLASGVAGAVDPKDTETIALTTQLIGNAIDGSVALFHATGWKPHTASPAAPVSNVPSPASAATPATGALKPGDSGY
jgi:hypothetical protein